MFCQNILAYFDLLFTEPGGILFRAISAQAPDFFTINFLVMYASSENRVDFNRPKIPPDPDWSELPLPGSEGEHDFAKTVRTDLTTGKLTIRRRAPDEKQEEDDKLSFFMPTPEQPAETN
ncbi:MAG: hypothetical protein J5I98_05605 [Phaeodactylibacter sp.]|nr:hypothetical protein [Phaeodactylibacter sp.]